ncbi:MAG: hypothetical protein E4H01_05095 [Lysobacterales bacterium]|nr:MAG: hypothetical protein E4H01_05095 [Xanthomonadales bacterium]
MTKEAAAQVVRECLEAEDVKQPRYFCEHGHTACSCRQGGECFTEACSVLGADALGVVIREHVEQRVQAKLRRREVSE